MKLKCCGCKARFDRETMSKLPAGWFHSIQCAIEYAGQKKNKQIDKAKRQVVNAKKAQKRKWSQDRKDFHCKTRIRACHDACHAYIRERDKDKDCPCCGEPLGDDFHAGHFIPDGSSSFLRYHEDNIHGQRMHCNMFRGGDSGEYENNLRERIGDEKVDYLKANKDRIIRRKAEDYKKIEVYFKEKLKELQGEECGQG